MAEYIEREALLKAAEKDKAIGLCEADIADVRHLINGQPAADVVEVVHGEWIDKPTGRYGQWQSWCSACGKHSGIGGIESNRHKPYCPNCGAKMQKEQIS